MCPWQITVFLQLIFATTSTNYLSFYNLKVKRASLLLGTIANPQYNHITETDQCILSEACKA